MADLITAIILDVLAQFHSNFNAILEDYYIKAVNVSHFGSCLQGWCYLEEAVLGEDGGELSQLELIVALLEALDCNNLLFVMAFVNLSVTACSYWRGIFNKAKRRDVYNTYAWKKEITQFHLDIDKFIVISESYHFYLNFIPKIRFWIILDRSLDFTLLLGCKLIEFSFLWQTKCAEVVLCKLTFNYTIWRRFRYVCRSFILRKL